MAYEDGSVNEHHGRHGFHAHGFDGLRVGEYKACMLSPIGPREKETRDLMLRQSRPYYHDGLYK